MNRTPAQQAAYDRLVGTAQTVRDQAAQGVIEDRYADTPTPAPVPASTVSAPMPNAATVVMFDRPGLCGPGVPGVYARTSRKGTPTPAQLTDAVIAAEAAHHAARAELRTAEAAAEGTYMGSPEWAAVAELDIRVSMTHSAWVRATRAVGRSIAAGL